ncbi:3-isopropylmalate dehydratase large subunit [Roseovarius sp. MMSF_3281]|uniref:3-isopropylmalate dehydratase large subunit n=1 Tax=Roseovarius sp. MMSF_3281 TaxID=3046694 RepID=UPI00273E7983|nr:3-isopropylmalate dehydratase large subunit [Roseovarius sp. MMSF_3281]
MTTPQTLYEKIVAAHTVEQLDEETVLLYVDFHIMNEYTSPQAFAGLHSADRPVWRPETHLAVVDHVNPTRSIKSLDEMDDADARLQIENLGRNCQRHDIEIFDLFDTRQGIEHVVVPENGYALPGMVIACGDSHTTTYGALGALGFGIGTSEIEHILATQTLVYQVLKPMRVRFEGALPDGVTGKDMVMAFIAEAGVSGAVGYAVEFQGEAISALDVEARMTICNMAVEGGARAAMIAPDEKTFSYVSGRPRSPQGEGLDAAKAHWKTLQSDPGANWAKEIVIDMTRIAPQVTWGTSPDQCSPVNGQVPDPAAIDVASDRAAAERALEYMGLTPGMKISDIHIDRVFIGSCTNSRIEDLRAAARILEGKRVADGVVAIAVPGSQAVKREAEAEGIADIFRDAGFEWRGSGCSMCLAMNDDFVPAGERCASSTNRNFEGRQGRGARTHLMSPEMVAAAAVTGRVTDVRNLQKD